MRSKVDTLGGEVTDKRIGHHVMPRINMSPEIPRIVSPEHAAAIVLAQQQVPPQLHAETSTSGRFYSPHGYQPDFRSEFLHMGDEATANAENVSGIKSAYTVRVRRHGPGANEQVMGKKQRLITHGEYSHSHRDPACPLNTSKNQSAQNDVDEALKHPVMSGSW